jgi:phosphoglucosamine mutase
VAPAVFHELGADVVAVAASPNGFNINDGCGAVHSDNLAAQVEAHDADYGIALDGDADRLIMAERGGVRFDGDQLLYAIACERQTRMPVPGVVGTLMTNFGVEQAFIRRGMGFVRAKVGDRYVLESLEQQGWQLGGENSGHLICLDKHTTGDGIISALQALAAARRLNTSLRELTADLVMATQCMINVPVKTGFVWTHDAGLVQAVADAERTLGSDGRVLIRPSGTEPVVRVMVESGDANLARTLASALAARLAA